MVYVDELRTTLRNSKWPYDQGCHLFADSIDELIEFALNLGLKRKWIHVKVYKNIQVGPTTSQIFSHESSLNFSHFDLTPNMRRKAVKAGAQEILLIEYIKRKNAR